MLQNLFYCDLKPKSVYTLTSKSTTFYPCFWKLQFKLYKNWKLQTLTQQGIEAHLYKSTEFPMVHPLLSKADTESGGLLSVLILKIIYICTVTLYFIVKIWLKAPPYKASQFPVLFGNWLYISNFVHFCTILK